jgi:hypothetical protein
LSTSDNKYDFINNKTCPYCQSRLKKGADFIVCSNCGTPHHRECWDENGGCTTYGCKENPLTEKKIELESEDVGNETLESLRESLRSAQVPAQNYIQCPNCKAEIEDSSVYCKFCGYNVIEKKFDEAKKEFEKEYKKRYKDKLSFTRRRTLITAASFTILIAAVAFIFYLTVSKLNAHFSSDEYKIESTVFSWKAAWENKDIDKYKSYLTEDYQYISKDRKKINLKEKLRRIESTFRNYKSIDIKFRDFKFVNDSIPSENDRKVQFMEYYESDKFSENGVKTLRLFKGEETNGEWKIYREIFE